MSLFSSEFNNPSYVLNIEFQVAHLIISLVSVMTVSWKLKLILNVSVNSNWVHPRGLAQKPCLGGSGFDF